MKRNRLLYAIFLVTVIGLGLLSRKLAVFLPGFVNFWLGDALWAAMIFLGFAFVFSRRRTMVIAFLSAGYCLLTECSQLYQASWINELRNTGLGGLVLGYGFLWTDLAAYALGIAVCAGMEYTKRPSAR
ncbi:DUF2809 domain-containing protein [Bacillus sp. FJAT-42376]|uniref:ribosomal maturation YjgA family protein n=1 Tax=Bacillus sp. FJAT-42376 TaxID=2014076 RepID=UPI000F5123A8|nr:DUF2809 domain-containing protein [Bacillus sp. FJAT-42376]AZB44626.1 DUF2809 domain-containing protein [Bacillus sp. FJAT-42376]